MEKASELTATVTSNLPQHFSFRNSLKLALEKTGLFNRELPPEATKQQRWEARFEGPLLIVSIVFLAFFAWYTLAEPGGWAETISGYAFTLIWVVFGVDYVVRLVLSEQRWHWFLRHIPELILVLVPWFRPLQILRVVPTLLLLQRVSSSNKSITVATYTIVGTIMMVLVAALSIYDVEHTAPVTAINSFGDALWWSIVTVTTVGYGDIAPVTAYGRVIGIGLMTGGIAIAGVLTATVAAALVEQVDGNKEEFKATEANAHQAELADLRTQLRTLEQQNAEISARLDALLQHANASPNSNK